VLENLITYAISHHLIYERDRLFIRNQLAYILNITNPLEIPKKPYSNNIEELLQPVLEYAVANGIIKSLNPYFADLFDTLIMGVFCDFPSYIQINFEKLHKESPQKATNWFYQYNIHTNYIRMNRIKKNIKWSSITKYGSIEITINLSKPEKDPKAIAEAQNLPTNNYPQCFLCKENEGYMGSLSHPARQNLRTIQIKLLNENWYFQYSPYIYYPEHSILLSETHQSMKINQNTFKNLLEFLIKFPHYFIGSNADLPIVGGSILAHEHYQTGKYSFPINNAKCFKNYTFYDIKFSLLEWPLNVIRFSSKNINTLQFYANSILNYWKEYSNPDLDIHAFTNQESHNTITPIARLNKENYELDIVLRNNKTNTQYPMGIFHPHQEYHHIKKENIGLIEVMGLAILPGRLLKEIELIKKILLIKDLTILNEIPSLERHSLWIKKMFNTYQFTEHNINQIIQDEIAKIFVLVLEDCGVFKRKNEFQEFFELWLNKNYE